MTLMLAEVELTYGDREGEDGDKSDVRPHVAGVVSGLELEVAQTWLHCIYTAASQLLRMRERNAAAARLALS